jgi:Rap1a immunity proteins
MWKSLLTGLLLASAPAFPADDAPEDYSDLEAKDPATSIQRLYAICSSTDKAEQRYCDGYITAMVESMIAVGKEPLARQYGICPTTPISVAASVQAFKNWAQRHPRHGNLIRYSGVAWALQERWPCSG